jgi:hypothetical protein
MMFDKVVDPETLRARPGGFAVGVRLPWYRALPLSTVSVNYLSIDGREVSGDRITFALNNGRWSLEALANQTDEMWFITDTAMLEVDGVAVEAGTAHEIEAEIEIRPPYVKGLKRVGRVTKTMTAN